jgi:F0F1-type ATP synthase membrane subunit a
VGVHWQGAGVGCHLDTLGVTWVVTLICPGWCCSLERSSLFILTSNWIGAIIPWSLLELPAASGELSAPTNDINLTACLALITSHATFYTGFSEFGWLYPIPMKCFRPVAYLVPLNLLEEFSKPLSLSFRLLGNILADELTLAVLYGLVPIAVPTSVKASSACLSNWPGPSPGCGQWRKG